VTEEWVDLQVSHHLGRVQAPDELWQRIEHPRPRRRTVPRLAVVAAAVAAVIAVAYSSARPREIHRVEAMSSGTCNLCHTM